MKAKQTPINIDGLSFKVHDSLGHKRLIPPKGIKALGTFIGELEKEYGEKLRSDLIQEKFVSTNAIEVSKVAEEDWEKARSFWQEHSGKEMDGNWVAIYVANMTWHAYLPHSTLLKIVRKVDKLLSNESVPPKPPWLFREKPIAAYVCRKKPYKGMEEKMLATLEEGISGFSSDNGGLLFDPITDEVLRDTNQFVKKLKHYGLFSAKENLMKLYELQRWGFHNLEEYYKNWLGNPKRYGVSKDQSLGGLATKLFHELSLETARQEPMVILDLRKNLVDQLNQLGYLDELKNVDNGKRILAELVSDPNLKQYMTGIGFLWEYIHSPERRNVSKDQEVSDIIEFPISLEWFLHNRPSNGNSPFIWLAKCEKQLNAAEIDREKQLFTRIDGKSVILYVANQDGTIPKLVSYRVN